MFGRPPGALPCALVAATISASMANGHVDALTLSSDTSTSVSGAACPIYRAVSCNKKRIGRRSQLIRVLAIRFDEHTGLTKLSSRRLGGLFVELRTSSTEKGHAPVINRGVLLAVQCRSAIRIVPGSDVGQKSGPPQAARKFA